MNRLSGLIFDLRNRRVWSTVDDISAFETAVIHAVGETMNDIWRCCLKAATGTKRWYPRLRKVFTKTKKPAGYHQRRNEANGLFGDPVQPTQEKECQLMGCE